MANQRTTKRNRIARMRWRSHSPSAMANQRTTKHSGVDLSNSTVVGAVSIKQAAAKNIYNFKIKGDFVAEEVAFNVVGLPNPYLGLQAFRYADRASYAGRSQIIAALVRRIAASERPWPLLFILGASGSGKSSLARAGLLPALEAHYTALGYTVRLVDDFRPSRTPINGLIATLLQLGILINSLQAADLIAEPQLFATLLQQHTSEQQHNLIVLDQFEEVFTQSDAVQRNVLFAVLSTLPPVQLARTHIIVTMRSDYLSDLFVYQEMYELAITEPRLDLRAMTPAELEDAIQQPLYQAVEAKGKRFEPALMQKLVEDATHKRLPTDPGGDPANLPLLQMTLEELWKQGSLRLSAYQGLAAAIQRHAEHICDNVLDANGQLVPRPRAEQDAMLALLLDLVEVALDDDPRHDVRRTRSADELERGDPTRKRIINELYAARLLSNRTEQQEQGTIELVDIIHESLLTNWERLRTAINLQRDRLRQRARFEFALRSYRANPHRLLDGVELAEAEELERQNDIALQAPKAQDLLRESRLKQQATLQRELEQVKLLAEEQRLRAMTERRARNLLLVLVVFLLGLSLLAVSFPMYQTWLQWQTREADNAVTIEGLQVAFEPYEVTNQRYQLCVAATYCSAPLSSDGSYFSAAAVDREKPVTGVDLSQAQRFCAWVGGRLPTVAEWQFAAFAREHRGNTRQWEEMVATAIFADQAPAVVGTSASSSRTPEGVFNLLGNVWEWTTTEQQGQQWNGDIAQFPSHVYGTGGSVLVSHPPLAADEEAAVVLFRSTDRRETLGFRCVYD
jgi:formylglycine-generating enzyme required for sulfatase activity